MKPEVKQKFVAALRSGDFVKTEGRLYRKKDNGTDSYCALGVLCFLAMEDGVDGLTFDPNDDRQLHFFRGPERNAGDGSRLQLLPTVVEKWAGIKNDEAFYIYAKNDTHGHNITFPEVADWVEANL